MSHIVKIWRYKRVDRENDKKTALLSIIYLTVSSLWRLKMAAKISERIFTNSHTLK